MVKKYVNEDNLQIAMTEYNNLGKGDAVITQYDDIVGVSPSTSTMKMAMVNRFMLS
ncbi:hypothetical protein [Streptococcus suis]|uniref:hypothetical protein n=1 Tax=Streptococcus suis TaxID=1307 RepID=UPI0024121A89|nr:hypothetical protein [Streptococcus suis]MDG4479479.1 hypothetical protein [Streptococcus suis]MDG4485666.1 hypothetical protein [Streptococcus suis]